MRRGATAKRSTGGSRFLRAGCTWIVGSTAACASNTHYATARLLAPGEQAFVLSADVTHVQDRAAGTDRGGLAALGPSQSDPGGPTPRFRERKESATTLIGVPTLRYRRGVGTAVQLGGHLGGRGVGLELALALLRGKTSVAWLIAPSFTGNGLSLDAPLLVSRALHERIELVGSIGFVASTTVGSPAIVTDGVFGRLGAGLRVRFNSWLFLFPEAIAAESIGRDRRDTWFSAGLGVGGDFR